MHDDDDDDEGVQTNAADAVEITRVVPSPASLVR